MGKDSNIEWTDDTANWWWGCDKVSPGCKRCYADVLAHRRGFDIWGRRAPRRFIKGCEGLLHSLQSQALREGRDRLVFLNSMSDFFEDHDGMVIDHQGFQLLDKHQQPVKLQQLRDKAFAMMGQCPNLHHIILTKRPENIGAMWKLKEPAPGFEHWHYPNVFLGTSVESADYLLRVTELLKYKRLAPVLVISAEPLLGGFDIPQEFLDLGRRGWVIDGGESQHGSRPMDPAWARRHRDQCREAGVPYFFKQWGDWYPEPQTDPLTVEHHGDFIWKRLGKANAGRLLDGAEHSAIPLGNRRQLVHPRSAVL